MNILYLHQDLRYKINSLTRDVLPYTLEQWLINTAHYDARKCHAAYLEEKKKSNRREINVTNLKNNWEITAVSCICSFTHENNSMNGTQVEMAWTEGISRFWQENYWSYLLTDGPRWLLRNRHSAGLGKTGVLCKCYIIITMDHGSTSMIIYTHV